MNHRLWFLNYFSNCFSNSNRAIILILSNNVTESPKKNYSNNYNAEKMFRIKTVPLCPGKILQAYQADEITEINIAGKFLVKTKDKEFSTTIYPFLQTDYLVDQLTGKADRSAGSSIWFQYSQPYKKHVKTFQIHRPSHSRIFPSKSSEYFLINFMEYEPIRFHWKML